MWDTESLFHVWNKVRGRQNIAAVETKLDSSWLRHTLDYCVWHAPVVDDPNAVGGRLKPNSELKANNKWLDVESRDVNRSADLGEILFRFKQSHRMSSPA